MRTNHIHIISFSPYQTSSSPSIQCDINQCHIYSISSPYQTSSSPSIECDNKSMPYQYPHRIKHHPRLQLNAILIISTLSFSPYQTSSSPSIECDINNHLYIMILRFSPYQTSSWASVECDINHIHIIILTVSNIVMGLGWMWKLSRKLIAILASVVANFSNNPNSRNVLSWAFAGVWTSVLSGLYLKCLKISDMNAILIHLGVWRNNIIHVQ
jgi:hypothetical protein